MSCHRPNKLINYQTLKKILYMYKRNLHTKKRTKVDEKYFLDTFLRHTAILLILYLFTIYLNVREISVIVFE